ncbi:MAG TPA: hypothetical protein DCR44_06355 [Acholeplasmatales bacterium]|nr:hypothetical protein [Acholeplasmatales bacterium]
MKKTFLLICVFSLTLSMMGCPPLTTRGPHYASLPQSEAVFSLPEGASIISESFTCETTNQLDEINPSESLMTVSATYTIMNDGEDSVFGLAVPFYPSNLDEVDEFHSGLTITIDGIQQMTTWTFRNGASTFPSPSDVSFTALQDDFINPNEYSVNEIFYQYEFLAPRKGTFETLTITLPPGTPILGDMYHTLIDQAGSILNGRLSYDGGPIVVPSFDNPTTGRFISIGAPAVFSFSGDYEMTLYSSTTTFEQRIGRFGTPELRLAFLRYRMASFIASDDLYEDYYYCYNVPNVTDLVNVFSILRPLLGSGTETVVNVTFPLNHGAYTEGDHVYIYYDVHLEHERYLDEEITVFFHIDSDLTLYAIEGVDEPSFDFTIDPAIRSHLRIAFEIPYLFTT